MASNKQINKQERAFSKSFNPLFLRFSLKPRTRGIHEIHGNAFQSSFLRFSLKLRIRDLEEFLRRECFNPLFWGFLWNSCWSIRQLNWTIKFQSSFLRFSLKLEKELEEKYGVTIVSILFFEVFFETPVMKSQIT